MWWGSHEHIVVYVEFSVQNEGGRSPTSLLHVARIKYDADRSGIITML